MSEATRTLQQLLTQLKREQQENAIQTEAVEGALRALNGRAARSSRSKPGSKPMSAARRRQISKRMKAMWAKKHREGKT